MHPAHAINEWQRNIIDIRAEERKKEGRKKKKEENAPDYVNLFMRMISTFIYMLLSPPPPSKL